MVSSPATLAAVIPTTWGFLSVLALFGGLGLFLRGLEQLSEGMKQAAGQGLKALLGRLTKTRLSALGLGLVVTMMLQSSSATTVILVSLVQASLLPAARSIGVIMGANIGTTFTGQLIAFKLTDYSLGMLAVGFLVRAVLKPGRGRELGNVLVGLGLLFFGLGVMSEAMKPLRASETFRAWIAGAESLPVGLLVGAVFTAVVQSSSATTGIVIGLASQGLIPLEAAIPVLLGANLGTCVTAWLAAMKATPTAKRVAAAHVIFNLGGIALFAAWIPPFAELVRAFTVGVTGGDASGGIARQVANAHTLFNVAAALVFLPLGGLIVRITEWLFPDVDEERPFPPLRRDLVASFARAPDLALVRSRQALRVLGTALSGELTGLDRTFTQGASLNEDRLRTRFEQCRTYADGIAGYHADLLRLPLTEEQTENATAQALVLANIEPIARVLERDALPLASRVVREKAWFSEEGRAELMRFARDAERALRESLTAFVLEDRDLARRALGHKMELRREMAEAQRAHIERVRAGRAESVETDRLHMEIVDLYRLILTYSGRIAEALLETGQG